MLMNLQSNSIVFSQIAYTVSNEYPSIRHNFIDEISIEIICGSNPVS